MSVFSGKGKWLWSAVLLLVWAALIALFIKTHGNLTVQQLLDYSPEEPLRAALVMLGLFTLKSLDFVMHSGVLYAADGVMFPLPCALALNLLGAAIMVTVPYFVGRSLGTPIAKRLREKYPKLAGVEKLRLGRGFLTAMFLRVASSPLTVLAHGAAPGHRELRPHGAGGGRAEEPGISRRGGRHRRHDRTVHPPLCAAPASGRAQNSFIKDHFYVN